MANVVKEVPQDHPLQLTAAGNTILSPAESQTLLAQIIQDPNATNLLQRHFAIMQSVSGMPWTTGNEAILMTNVQAACDAMLEAIRAAKDHIHLEAYKINDDAMGRRFCDLLMQKRREGVQVRLIYDSIGCYATPARFFHRLREAAVEVVEYNPANPARTGREWHPVNRNHSKLLIVDGRIAITGGINIRDPNSRQFVQEEGGGEERAPWRDTDVQITGPAVSEFQTIFLNTWESQKGPELAGTNFYPLAREQGNDLVMAVANQKGSKHRATFIMYNSAIAFAAQSIHLTSAYFAPDRQTRKTLEAAARRGVDVKIVLPGVTDHTADLYAGQYYYADLLEAGVKLYLRRGDLLHAKTGVIDGVWSTVGSSNLDYWSLLRNDEVNAIIISRGFAAQMERMFEDDLVDSDPIRREEWRNRSLTTEFGEWIAHLFVYWL